MQLCDAVSHSATHCSTHRYITSFGNQSSSQRCIVLSPINGEADRVSPVKQSLVVALFWRIILEVVC
ncbi:unnamed protein product [Timema podura]|uniref:Uncharacterized protein n=1 Tax=Timema podura TaxID=61482 RepID=A0ABN7P4L6_TIMPD|nr:unnamed protein product [Timema podura]